MWCGSKIVSALEADVSAESDDNGVVICTIENTYLQPSFCIISPEQVQGAFILVLDKVDVDGKFYFYM